MELSKVCVFKTELYKYLSLQVTISHKLETRYYVNMFQYLYKLGKYCCLNQSNAWDWFCTFAPF